MQIHICDGPRLLRRVAHNRLFVIIMPQLEGCRDLGRSIGAIARTIKIRPSCTRDTCFIWNVKSPPAVWPVRHRVLGNWWKKAWIFQEVLFLRHHVEHVGLLRNDVTENLLSRDARRSIRLEYACLKYPSLQFTQVQRTVLVLNRRSVLKPERMAVIFPYGYYRNSSRSHPDYRIC